MEIMNTKETADYLRVSYWHFMRMFYTPEKNHPPFYMLGKERRFLRAEVEAWLKSQKGE